MSSINFLPGIQHLAIFIEDIDENNKEVKVNFTVNGMNRIKDPIFKQKVDFHLYIFLTYQNGGKDTIVVSSSHIHFDEKMLDANILHFTTKLEMPLYPDEDFLSNYYSLEIIHSDIEAQDGSDINSIFHLNQRIFSTKLNIK